MISATTLIAISLANPKKVNIPGLGADVSLPAWLAYIGLWLAMSYFAWEYFAEWRFVRRLNSQGNESLRAESEAAMLNGMSFQIDSVQKQMEDHANILLSFRNEFDSNWERTLREYYQNLALNATNELIQQVRIKEIAAGTNIADLRDMISDIISIEFGRRIAQFRAEWDSTKRVISDNTEMIQNQLPKINALFSELNRSLKGAKTSYSTISRSINGNLRWMFLIRYTAIPAIMFVCGTLIPLFFIVPWPLVFYLIIHKF
jgi:hypothetical protein